MIKVILFCNNNLLTGFEISGHSTVNESDTNGKIICSAVSSAAIMAANTVTEVICDNADINVKDGYLKLSVESPQKCQSILSGLKLHLTELQNEYPEKIKVITEVEP